MKTEYADRSGSVLASTINVKLDGLKKQSVLTATLKGVVLFSLAGGGHRHRLLGN